MLAALEADVFPAPTYGGADTLSGLVGRCSPVRGDAYSET